MSKSSSTSIEDEEICLPKKRYKKFLYADHQTHDVSQQTKKRWEIKTGNFLPLYCINYSIESF